VLVGPTVGPTVGPQVGPVPPSAGALAAPTVQAVGTSAVANSASNVVASWPAHAANDIGILIASGFGPNAYAAPVGWGTVANSPQVTSDVSAAGSRLSVFWRRAASAAEVDATVVDVASDDAKLALIVVVRGCTTSGTPWDATAGSVENVVTNSISIPGLATTGANRLVLAIVAQSNDVAGAQVSGFANASLAGVVEVMDDNTTTGGGAGVAVASGVLAVAGAVSATTGTLAGSAAQLSYLTIALKP
jgi:hypothetical protein